jgi:hypothetical protein
MNVKIKLVLLFVFVNLCLLGQNTVAYIPLNKDGSQSFTYKHTNKIISQLQLNDIKLSSYPIHTRIWLPTRIFETWIDEEGNKTALHISYNDIIDGDSSIYTCQIDTMSTIQSNSIFSYMSTPSFLNLLPQDSIQGWGLVLDGDFYNTETLHTKQYSLKSYDSPAAISDNIEAMILAEIIKRVHKITQSDQLYEEFFETLPYGCYKVAGGITIRCKFEKKKIKKRQTVTKAKFHGR